MSDPVISVDGLSKCYLISQHQQERYTALRDVLAQTARGAAQRLLHPFKYSSSHPLDTVEELWALRDVSFEVERGERLGIIGRNGAGKSTLLKTLARITEPTRGRIEIEGRVASLLEVGTGFHPELTGRENIFLNGAILGMTKQEIRRKFDEIVSFAEVERFLDTPVKRYSSGMFVRLAFAVAAHLEPEILVVDEVLAVGDAGFQKKCLGKMQEVGESGRTVLFVSHNMLAVQSLCERALWLEEGRISQRGAVTPVVAAYLQRGAHLVTEQRWEDRDSAPGNDQVRIRRVALLGQGNDQPDLSQEVRIQIEVWNSVPHAVLNFSLSLFSMEGVCILATASSATAFPKGIVTGTVSFPADFFNNDSYRVRIMVVKDGSRSLYILEDALVFEMYEQERRNAAWYGKYPGLLRPKLAWETSCSSSEAADPH